MNKGRLEAFSDGVLAIIITIMVLELKVPHGDSLAALAPLAPVLLGYVLSFVYVGIYWNNHHHLLHTATRVTGGIMWANLHLLFWLSLLPAVTAWAGEYPHVVVAGGALRRGPAGVGVRLADLAAGHHRRRQPARANHRRRREGADLAGAVRGGHRGRFRSTLDLRAALRDRGGDLGRAGSPGRARPHVGRLTWNRTPPSGVLWAEASRPSTRADPADQRQADAAMDAARARRIAA